MSIWKHYRIAKSTDEALHILGEAPGKAKIIAGGTDLLIDIQQGRHAEVATLVDVNDIPGMNAIEIRNGKLFIGASTPHRAIAQSPLVREHAAALAKASGMIGGPQVRNTATLGGNVAHALPAADGAIALMALKAEAEVASLEGRRNISMAELYRGPGKSTLDPARELLFGFFVPLRQEGHDSAFNRVMRPQGVAIAILNLAVWLERRGDSFGDIRIVVGPSGPVPRRMTGAETLLRGRAWTDQTSTDAHKAILDEAVLRTSRHRASGAYRKDIVATLLGRTVEEAWAKTGG